MGSSGPFHNRFNSDEPVDEPPIIYQPEEDGTYGDLFDAYLHEGCRSLIQSKDDEIARLNKQIMDLKNKIHSCQGMHEFEYQPPARESKTEGFVVGFVSATILAIGVAVAVEMQKLAPDHLQRHHDVPKKKFEVEDFAR